MKTTSVYNIFAENLRLLCNRFGTIAEVCRQTGINRQQFNKYLAGTNLPSPRIMLRLSEFFSLEEYAFFQPGTGDAVPSAQKREDETARLLGNHAKHMLSPANGELGLQHGIYKVYSAWLPNPQYFFVFTVEVFGVDGRMQFHWNYSFKGNPFYQDRPTTRWNRGFVFTDQGKTSLIGKMTKPALPGLIVMQLDHANKWPNGLSSGIVTGFMPNNLPFAGTVVLQRLPAGTSRLAALRSNGVHAAQSTIVPEQIQQLLQNQPRSNANHMTAVDMMKSWQTVAISQKP